MALCFGWIDAQTRGLDDAYWLKRFTPAQARQPLVEDQHAEG